MKSASKLTTLDELGRLVIPNDLLKTLNISENDSLEILTDSNKLIIKRYSLGHTKLNPIIQMEKFKNMCIHKDTFKPFKHS